MVSTKTIMVQSDFSCEINLTIREQKKSEHNNRAFSQSIYHSALNV